MEDNASLSCLLCVQKFTYSNRRHHCRTCGALVCDLCSTKRLHTTKSNAVAPSGKSSSARNSQPTTPPPSAGSAAAAKKAAEKGLDRVCDGCFNKLSFECFLWQQAVAKVRRHQEKLAAENPELLINDVAIADNGRGGGGGSSVDRARNVATETRRALEQRGERLQQASERSEELRQGASDFNQMTGQILKQAREKQRTGGWM